MTPLQATKDTGVLRLTVNEDAEERKPMHLHAWYDDDNAENPPQVLRDAIKEEHDSLQKTEEQFRQVIQTTWVIQQRPGNNTNKRFKARFAAKGYTQHINPDELHAATPATVTLRMLLCLGQIKKYNIYIILSDIANVFLNTPVQQGMTILAQPPQSARMHLNDENVLCCCRSNHMVYDIHHKNSKYTFLRYYKSLV
eukprot:182891-Amphidinium_carterae.1